MHPVYFLYFTKAHCFVVIMTIQAMPKTHPLLIKRIGTTLLDHVPGALTVFPMVKLGKVDLECPKCTCAFRFRPCA